jgi:hypothetical protein
MVVPNIFVEVSGREHNTLRPAAHPPQAEQTLGEVAEWLKATAGNGRYTAQAVSEVRILPLSAKVSIVRQNWAAFSIRL